MSVGLSTLEQCLHPFIIPMAPPPDLSNKVLGSLEFINNHPKPGVVFIDDRHVRGNHALRSEIVQDAAKKLKDQNITVVACLESRGFDYGALLADALGCGQIRLRKKGKLPDQGNLAEENYALEYGADCIQAQQDLFVSTNQETRVVIVDDILATGGTMAAADRLVTKCGGTVVGRWVLCTLSTVVCDQYRYLLEDGKTHAVCDIEDPSTHLKI
jgi:adenine phosphoribosyltransferase